MHSIHAILVNITDAIRNDEKKITEMTKEELKERVINYAENHTDSFYGFAFDGRELLEDEPVLFASDNWDAFEEMLLQFPAAEKALTHLAVQRQFLCIARHLMIQIYQQPRKIS